MHESAGASSFEGNFLLKMFEYEREIPLEFPPEAYVHTALSV
jgi:hypothetical protein